MTEQTKTTTWKIRPSRLLSNFGLHGCRRCWNPFLRLLLFLDSSRMFTPRSVAPVEGPSCFLLVVPGIWIDTYKLSYPLKKGCYPFAVLVWTVKIRCFGATKKEWKTCFSPNTRPFAIRSFKNTGTDLYYVQTHLRFWQQLKIIKFKGHWNHHITNLTSAQRGIDCLTFHDLPCFFCNHFTWDVVSDLFFIGDWGLLAKLCFLVSWLLVINESNYTCQTFADTEEVYDNRYTCVKITSELIWMTIFMSLLSKRV